MFRKIYFSTQAGGGVHGITTGIVHDTMTEDGLIIPIRRVSTEIFLRTGEIITEIIHGKDTGGNLSKDLNATFSATGKAGKKTGTGKNRDTVFRKLKKIDPLRNSKAASNSRCMDRLIGTEGKTPAIPGIPEIITAGLSKEETVVKMSIIQTNM